MIELNAKAIERAIERSKARRARATMSRFGDYLVTGDNGSLHLVRCFRDKDGRKLVDCSCRAGYAGMICYHIGAALALHVHVARQRADRQPAPLPEILVKPQPKSFGRMNGIEL